MSQIKVPTHFRFRKRKEATRWDRTTKDWIPIETINGFTSEGFQLSALSFAWVDYDKKEDNLEFAVRPIDMCDNCHDYQVEKKGDLCDYCQQDDENESGDPESF